MRPPPGTVGAGIRLAKEGRGHGGPSRAAGFWFFAGMVADDARMALGGRTLHGGRDVDDGGLCLQGQ